MFFEISSFYREEKIRLKPRVELYDTRDYMGHKCQGWRSSSTKWIKMRT